MRILDGKNGSDFQANVHYDLYRLISLAFHVICKKAFKVFLSKISNTYKRGFEDVINGFDCQDLMLQTECRSAFACQ